MIAHAIPAGRVFKPADMIADPHFQAREALIDVPHPRWANLKMQGVFPKLSKTPGSIRSIAPQSVGQDNALYGEMLGLSSDELDDLAKRNII